MITELKLKLSYADPSTSFDYNIASTMHGVLMEHLESDYQDYMHRDGLRPYTQAVLQMDSQSFLWRICTLTKEAEEKIIQPLLQKENFFLKYKDQELRAESRELRSISYESLISDYYFEKQPRVFHMEFMTPTAFKSHGEYVFMPSVRLIFQSLMRKYDAFSTDTAIGNDEILEQIENNVRITGYRLRSVKFSLEGIRVPAFMGTITMYIKGPQQLVNLIRMMAEFGQYSGVGIKTSLGMGTYKIKKGFKHDKRSSQNRSRSTAS